MMVRKMGFSQMIYADNRFDLMTGIFFDKFLSHLFG